VGGEVARTGPDAAQAQPEIHHSHRDVTGGWLRPTVFGAMDGLVSNLALISGVAGGDAEPNVVALAGLAGLAAGAFSMAVGEYTSVASQSELALAEIQVERAELHRRPRAEQAELAQLYIARGVDPDLAHKVAEQLSTDPERALEIHAREELGINPRDLPSPWVAAISSFLAFALGAFVPVLPYLVGASSIWPALVLAMSGLFLCGAIVSRVTARTWWYTGLRQLVLGVTAAGITYVFGSLVASGLT
jgi:VIT1/CCC1 family predicted Fe2+/Mn2+ transporter